MKNISMNKNRRFFIKAVSGNLNETEKVRLEELIKDSENRKQFEVIQHIWNKTNPERVFELPDINDSWIELNNRIVEAEKFSSETKIKHSSVIKTKLKPAFALLIFLIIAAVSFFLLYHKHEPELKAFTTGNKEYKNITLPDGSSVTLNSGSSIQFYEGFEDNIRNVKLTGEAFFSVVKDSRPFVVLTDNAKTTVLGTEFNVYSRFDKTRVYVKEGRVILSQINNNKKSVKLTEGELSTIKENRKPTNPEITDPDYAIGWMENKLVFNHTRLKEVVSELERFYNVPVKIENEKLEDHTITGSFEDLEIQNVLEMICLTLNLDLVNQNKGYLIKQK